MDARRILFALATCLLLFGTGVTTAAAAAGSQPVTTCSAALFDGDRRLGPDVLPVDGEVGRELRDYQRTGALTVAQFLATYWDPPDNGYVIGANGQPEVSQVELHPGELIDRFGSEFGAFLAPEGSSYASRS